MSLFGNDDTTAWEIYLNAIESIVNTDPPLYVQPLSVASRAEFDTDFPLFNLFLKNQLADDIPEWGPLYGRSLANVSDGYRAFLAKLNDTVITQTGGGAAERLREQNAHVQERREGLRNLRRSLKEEYADYLSFEETPLDFNGWLDQEGYRQMLENTRREVEIANGRYIAASNAAGSELLELARAQAILDSDSSLIALPDSQEIAGNDPESWEKYLRQTIQVNIDRFKSDVNQTSFSVDETQSRQTETFTRWSAGGSFSYGWFNLAGGYASAEGSRYVREAQSETRSIRFTFKNIAQFPVTRGNWFNGSMLREYAPRISADFWRSQGRLPLLPEAVVLAHGTEIEIETTDSYSRYVHEKWSRRAGGGFRIGCFRFGASGGSSGERRDTIVERTSTGLKVIDNSGRANIVAVRSLRPIDLLPGDIQPLMLGVEEISDEQAQEVFRSLDAELKYMELETE